MIYPQFYCNKSFFHKMQLFLANCAMFSQGKRVESLNRCHCVLQNNYCILHPKKKKRDQKNCENFLSTEERIEAFFVAVTFPSVVNMIEQH